MKTLFSNGLALITLASGLLLLPGWAEAGTITRVSVDSTGGQANNDSRFSSLSADGRFVAFDSDASNLVAGDTNDARDIFVHDRQSGTTTRVSVDSAGQQANGGSYTPSISADGRFVAFASSVSSLVAGDTNGQWDVFVHDRQTGTTTRASVDSTGGQGNSASYYPSISADGRIVVFESIADNLVAGDRPFDPYHIDIFVHDRQTGITTSPSLNSNCHFMFDYCSIPSLSADGRFVAFTRVYKYSRIFVHDRQTGINTAVDVGGVPIPFAAASVASSISADGRIVVFESIADNVVAGDTNGANDIFMHDRQTGTTTRVSVDSAGNQANGGSGDSSISADGRFVAFQSGASNLVAGDMNGTGDTFVHDRQTGTTTRVSVGSAGGEANGSSGNSSLSADGRFVAFASNATNLVAGDTNSTGDIFVHQGTCGPDTDCDGIPDTQDNCLFTPNGPLAPDAGGHSQRDTNSDGFGNVCDADLNNDGRVTAMDYTILRSRLNTTDPDADLDGDGQVTVTDYQILRGLLNKPPGPSGLVP